MPRTTVELVGEIIEVDAAISLTPFIAVASAMVVEHCEPAGYDEERLTLIETWLAAHLYTIRDPRASAERAGSVGVTYEGEVSLNLAGSRYGQQAMMLDTEGKLASLSSRKRRRTASVVWLGTEEG